VTPCHGDRCRRAHRECDHCCLKLAGNAHIAESTIEILLQNPATLFNVPTRRSTRLHLLETHTRTHATSCCSTMLQLPANKAQM
jgi:hypothetical protein